MAEQLRVNEVGPRDGLQNQSVHLNPQQRLDLIRALLHAGLRSLEVGSFVSPKAVPQMAGTEEVVAALPKQDEVRYVALIPNRKGYETARDLGVKTVSIPVSATDTMNQKNLRMDTAQITAVTSELLRQASQDGIGTLVYVSVAFSCPFEGPVAPDLVAAMTAQFFDAGADEVVIADTIGAAHPGEVKELLGRLVEAHDAARLSCHFHDTRALALANVFAGLEVGIRSFDSSIGGLGGCPFAPGAAGNLATEDLVMMAEQMGFATGVHLGRLMEASTLAAQLTGNSGAGARCAPWLRRQLQQAAA